MEKLSLNATRIPAKTAGKQLDAIVLELHVKGTDLARGLNMNEAQLNRMRHKKSGFYRSETLRPITRITELIELAEKIFTKEGIQEWFNTPNSYLNDLPPLLCLRTDKEAQKVHGLLTALGRGFPA